MLQMGKGRVIINEKALVKRLRRYHRKDFKEWQAKKKKKNDKQS